MLVTSTAAELEARPAIEDVDVVRANTRADPSVDPAVTAAATTMPAPLDAVAGLSVPSPAEEATVVVALAPFAGANPAIASSSSNAIPMDVKCAW